MKSLSGIFCFTLLLLSPLYSQDETRDYFNWTELSFSETSQQAEALDTEGSFIGTHNNALIIAGGVSNDKLLQKADNTQNGSIWVLEDPLNDNKNWIHAGNLPEPVEFGTSVSTPQGIVCMGGKNSKQLFDTVYLLKWNPDSKKIEMENLPNLPQPCAHSSAFFFNNAIYLAGGNSTVNSNSAMQNFWRLDMANYGTEQFKWEILPSWPGPARSDNILVHQHNGYDNCIYVISGKGINSEDGSTVFLNDVYEFNPKIFTTGKENYWRKRADIPVCVMQGKTAEIGQSHIFVFQGNDEVPYPQADSLKQNSSKRPQNIWALNTITNTWFEAGNLPSNQLATQLVQLNDQFIITTRDIQTGENTPKIWSVVPIHTSKTFDVYNLSALGIYLLILIWIGIYFSKRNKSTEDYFRGGQRIPWWAAGCSIFATMLSSLTFMSVPSKTFATDWVYFFINMTIVLLAPFIIYFILPFFRKIDATSAYEYLEKRFNLPARLFASASFILFQIGRMAIVMFLPSLALATITPLSVETCILIMGGMSILYCTLGGVEAVIWTDTIQTFVLLGGALLSFGLIIFNIDGGINGFFTTALANQKFHVINWDWSSLSITTTALWVVVLGGFGQNLVSYSSDQGVVQRYMSVQTTKKASNAIWTNAALSFFASFLFFGVGTGLYVFYKNFPHQFDPTYQTDSVFAQFIAQELPIGIAGIVVAGIFAAAQSTISTSMNSIATTITTDFVRRFKLLKTEKNYLVLARTLTFSVGTIGTIVALFLASADIKSLWDSFIKVLGLFGGSMGGLFILGIFTKKANGTGAVIGALLAFSGLLYISFLTNINGLLYAALGITLCAVSGYIFSIFGLKKTKNIEGLTIYTIHKKNN